MRGAWRTGCEISHCPTSRSPFSCESCNGQLSIQEADRGILTSSAAMVTVWLVTMTGKIFAWLFVMDEKRKMADGRERKKA